MESLPQPKGLGTGPRTRAELVAERLRAMIVGGELPLGTRLRQTDIAELFQVSTTPVREAFTSLAREGFVHQDAHRGVEVFRPTEDDIRQNYEIRLVLEPMAAEHAARTVTAETLASLGGILDEMDGVVDFELGAQLNAQFHFTIHQAAQKPQLLYIIERLRRAADVYVRVLLARNDTDAYRRTTRKDHRAILECLRARDPEGARDAAARHLAHSLEQIERAIATAIENMPNDDAREFNGLSV